jgi:hypothetical protein
MCLSHLTNPDYPIARIVFAMDILNILSEKKMHNKHWEYLLSWLLDEDERTRLSVYILSMDIMQTRITHITIASLNSAYVGGVI